MTNSRRKYFLTILGKYVPKSKVKTISERMELTKDEHNLLICRFCDGYTREQIAFAPWFIPIDRQYRMLKTLEAKIRAWFEDNRDFFNKTELEHLEKAIDNKQE